VRKLAVIFGGPTPEHEISVLTGLLVGRILRDSGDDVSLLYWKANGEWEIVPSESEARDFAVPKVKGSRRVKFSLPGGFRVEGRFGGVPLDVECVVNCCHGGPGEGNLLTGLLTLSGYKNTGPGVEAGCLALDKFVTAAIAKEIGVNAIPTAIDVESVDFDGPWIIKPRFGGSSMNIEFGITELDTLRRISQLSVYKDGFVIQPYLAGWIDLNIAVGQTPDFVVSSVERPLKHKTGILGFEEKYLSGAGGMESAMREIPADIPVAIRDKIELAAVAMVKAMGLRGVPRVDFLWDGSEKVYLCEVNSIPGAMGLYLWESTGRSRDEILTMLINDSSRSVPGPDHWATRNDQRALTVARSLASKLQI